MSHQQSSPTTPRSDVRRGFVRRALSQPGTPLALGVAVAIGVTGCGASKLTGDSACRDYVGAARDAQMQAVQVVAQDNRRAYSFLVQNNVDARCSVAPDKTLQWAVAG